MKNVRIGGTAPKRLLLFAAILAFCKMVHASIVPGEGEVSAPLRAPSNYTSSAIYIATATCGASDFKTSVWVSTPSAGALFSINVSSPSNASAYIEVFDGFDSTATSRRVAYIEGDNARQHFFNVFFSSMIGVSNQGSPPACIETIFRQR